MLALATQWCSFFLILGGVGGPGDPNHQSKFQKDLTVFSCRQQLKLGGVRGLKLTGDMGYYGYKFCVPPGDSASKLTLSMLSNQVNPLWFLKGDGINGSTELLTYK